MSRSSPPSGLTRSFVYTVKPTGTKMRYPDNDPLGLYLRVTPAGAKTYVVRKRMRDGSRPEMEIGDASVLTLDQARSLARAELAKMESGTNPLAERRKAREAATESRANTLKAASDLFIADLKRKARKTSYIAQQEDLLDRVIVPRIGHKPVADLSKGKLQTTVEEISDAHGKATAFNAFTTLSMVLNYAVRREIISSNPMKGLAKPDKPAARDRVLSVAELRGLWLGMGDRAAVAAQRGIAYQLCMLTLQRLSEVAGMEWAEVDMDRALWTIPAERMKGGRKHTVPLTEEAVTLLKEAEKLFGKGTYVLPSLTDPKKAVNPDNVYAASREITDAKGWKPAGPHAMRHTGATIMGQTLRIAPEIRSLVLSHELEGGSVTTRKNYDHGDYADAKRDALTRWSQHLMTIIANDGSDDNVLPFDAAARKTGT